MIGLKNSYFPLIHLPSCYWTACYRTVCYRTVQQTNQIQSFSLNQPITFKVVIGLNQPITTLVSITIETVYKLLGRFLFDQIFRFEISGILCDEWNSIFRFVGLTNPRSSGSKFRAKIRDQMEGTFAFVYLL